MWLAGADRFGSSRIVDHEATSNRGEGLEAFPHAGRERIADQRPSARNGLDAHATMRTKGWRTRRHRPRHARRSPVGVSQAMGAVGPSPVAAAGQLPGSWLLVPALTPPAAMRRKGGRKPIRDRHPPFFDHGAFVAASAAQVLDEWTRPRDHTCCTVSWPARDANAEPDIRVSTPFRARWRWDVVVPTARGPAMKRG